MVECGYAGALHQQRPARSGTVRVTSRFSSDVTPTRPMCSRAAVVVLARAASVGARSLSPPCSARCRPAPLDWWSQSRSRPSILGVSPKISRSSAHALVSSSSFPCRHHARGSPIPPPLKTEPIAARPAEWGQQAIMRHLCIRPERWPYCCRAHQGSSGLIRAHQRVSGHIGSNNAVPNRETALRPRPPHA